MKFEIKIDDRTVNWEDGKLSGDEVLVLIIKTMEKEITGKDLGDTTYRSERDYLQHPITTMALINDIKTTFLFKNKKIEFIGDFSNVIDHSKFDPDMIY